MPFVAGTTWSRIPYRNGTNASIPDALFGDIDTHYLCKREKPAHRLWTELAQQGLSVKEIAAIQGVTTRSVSTALRQPWARARLTKGMKENTQAEMRRLLEAQLLPCVQTLVEVRDSPDTEPGDKIRASTSILDRFLGRPTQPVQEGAKPLSDMSDAELAKIAQGQS